MKSVLKWAAVWAICTAFLALVLWQSGEITKLRWANRLNLNAIQQVVDGDNKFTGTHTCFPREGELVPSNFHENGKQCWRETKDRLEATFCLLPEKMLKPCPAKNGKACSAEGR